MSHWLHVENWILGVRLNLLHKYTTLRKIAKIDFHLDKLWKLDGTTLMNKNAVWQSPDEWDFITEGTLMYIEKTSEGNKVLGTDGNMVTPEVKKENEKGQLWNKGNENAEGYFTLENHESSQFLTAISATGLGIKGN